MNSKKHFCFESLNLIFNQNKPLTTPIFQWGQMKILTLPSHNRITSVKEILPLFRELTWPVCINIKQKQ